MAKQLSRDIKIKVWMLHSRENKSIRAIAEEMQIPRSTVGDFLKKFSQTRSFDVLGKSGRKRTLSVKDHNLISSIVEANPKTSARVIAKELEEKEGKVVSKQTIRNSLHSIGFEGRVACKKPFIGPKNKRKRTELAEAWIMWPNEKWETVIWSDECKFNLHGSDGPRNVWRRKGERYEEKNLQPTFKHGGGSCMVWACMASSGVGRLVFIDGIMDSVSYCTILANNLKQSAAQLGLNQFIFQQDNDPKHKSRLTIKFLMDNRIIVLEWPAQSPDLNPIEHLWQYIKAELMKFKLKNIAELKSKMMEIWASISAETTKKLVDSMSKRIGDVLRAKGGHTKY